MDVKVVGQPEAARVEKNSAVHFTGTLVAYDPAPFFLHWDKAKVKEEDIPKDKGPKKAPVRRPTRKPSGRRTGAFLGPLSRSEEHTSELQSRLHIVCRLLLEKKKNKQRHTA